MGRGDKYSKASALSKIFEEMLSRNSGDNAKAARAMDDTFGDTWRLEIIIDDEVGPEFIDPAILELDVSSVEPEKGRLVVDDMFKEARTFSEKFVGPGDDLENEPRLNDRLNNKQKEAQSEHLCISDMLRQLADQIDKQKKKK